MPFGLLLQAQPLPPPTATTAAQATWPPPKSNDGPPLSAQPPRTTQPEATGARTVAKGARPTEPEVWPAARWFGRVTLGMGRPNASAQADLLELEGYSLRDTSIALDGGGFVKDWLAVGPFAIYTDTSGTATSSPSVKRWSLAGGIETPMVAGDRRSFRAVFTPRLGVATGKQYFHSGDVPARAAPYLGATLDLLPLGGLVGFGVWLSYAPASAPGAAGRRDDFGSIGLQLSGSIDG